VRCAARRFFEIGDDAGDFAMLTLEGGNRAAPQRSVDRASGDADFPPWVHQRRFQLAARQSSPDLSGCERISKRSQLGKVS